MGWHIRNIVRKCGLCSKHATVELRNGRNAVVGCYCRTCGQRVLRRRLREEQEVIR